MKRRADKRLYFGLIYFKLRRYPAFSPKFFKNIPVGAVLGDFTLGYPHIAEIRLQAPHWF